MSSTGDTTEAADKGATPSRAQPVVLLIDGHALVHRAYHALKDKGLSVRRTGEPTGATFGFTQTLIKALEEMHPAYWAIAFDLPTPTFRDALYAEYKAQRPPMPDELRAQMQRVRQIVEAFGVPVFEAEGFEADDVLGALSKQAVEQSLDVVILTGDTDTTQLIGPHARVSMWSGYTGEMATYDEARVRERYGVSPAQMADFKALKGDPSDNVPGVPGVGDKTAAKLLQQFDSIESIYQRIDEVEPKLREKLLANKETLLRGKKLTTIVTDVPVKLDTEACRVKPLDRGKLLELFRELEFSRLMERLPGAARPGQGPQQLAMFQDASASSGEAAARSVVSETVYRTITSAEELERLVRELREARTFAIDTETTGTDAMLAELVGVSVSPAEGVAAYIPVGHAQGQQLPRDAVVQALRPLLTDASLAKAAHNANYDMLVLANCGVPITPWAFDTMIAAYLLGYKALDLKSMAFDRLNVEMTRISELIGSGAKQISMAQVPIERAAPYACADADMTLRLKALLEPELRREDQYGLFADVEMPLVPVLVRMEQAGVKLDEQRLGEMAAHMEQQLRKLETEVYNQAGHQFNLNSPKQLGDVLFAEMKLGKSKKTRTGYSTEASILEGLRGVHPIIDKILDYRQFQKLKSTYVDALPVLVNPRTGRVHTSYSQTIAATGRLSSSDPNLQNIPVRTEEGREVRKAFVAEGAPDWQLLSGDYSQIELRIVAHMSGDADMIAAFQRGEDIHAATAAQVFNVPLSGVTPDMRRMAKAVNFGTIYGQGEFGLSQQIGSSREEAAAFIERYFQKYPGVKAYMERTKREARENGYVQTLLGRRRYIPEILSSNQQVRAAAERMAINHPVQGTAADIIKIAMIRVQQRMDEKRLRSRMLLQVHDELIFEVPQNEMETMCSLLLELMPKAMDLKAPLTVDLKAGPTWGDME